MWAAILAGLKALGELLGFLKARNDATAAVTKDRLQETTDALTQVDTANRARDRIDADLNSDPDSVRSPADPDTRPFNPDKVD